MKRIKLIYYVTTGLMSVAMFFAGYAYLASPDMKQIIVEHFGFPDFFRIEIGIAKIIAAIALWVPLRHVKISAYVGLAVMFLSGFIAHMAYGDPFGNTIAPLIALALLITSYISYNKYSTTLIK